MKQILKNKKICIRDFIAVIVIIFLSLFAEQVLLQWNLFKNEKYEQTFQISEAQNTESKDGETTYYFSFDGKYVSSIYLTYQSRTDIKSNIEVTFYDGYGQKEIMELEDTASFLLGKSAVLVNQKVDSLKLTVENKDAHKLNSVIFVNHTVFSWAKFLLVFSAVRVHAELAVRSHDEQEGLAERVCRDDEVGATLDDELLTARGKVDAVKVLTAEVRGAGDGDVEKTEIDGLLILRELDIGDVEARIRQAGEGLFLRIVVEETFIRAARVCAAVPPPG